MNAGNPTPEKSTLFQFPEEVTLRDRFAMAALAILTQASEDRFYESEIKAITSTAYKYADEMLEARKKKA